MGFHDLALAGPFVVDAAEVEDSVDDGAVKLLDRIGVERLGIGAHRVEADEDIARDLVAARIVEGDHVRVIVMLEILPVHLQNLLVRAEDVADVARLLAVRGCHLLDPCADSGLVDGGECRPLGVV